MIFTFITEAVLDYNVFPTVGSSVRRKVERSTVDVQRQTSSMLLILLEDVPHNRILLALLHLTLLFGFLYLMCTYGGNWLKDQCCNSWWFSPKKNDTTLQIRTSCRSRRRDSILERSKVYPDYVSFNGIPIVLVENRWKTWDEEVMAWVNLRAPPNWPNHSCSGSDVTPGESDAKYCINGK